MSVAHSPLHCLMNPSIACLVEDDPIHQFITNQHLEKSGFFDQILIFENGKKAYDHLKELDEEGSAFPDLILLDLNMPIWSGWDFLDALKTLSFEGTMTIYILTSSANEEDYLRAKEYGLDNRYLIKPITKENVQTVIAAIKN